MSALLDRISAGTVVLCDGAMGTMLIERGLKLGDCPEAWNLSRPEVLTEIARQYAEAGADMVETNTFGGTPLKLAQYGLDSRTEDITRSAIRAARTGAGANVLVALSCGPTGRLLNPFGDTEPEEILASFERQIKAAVSEGIDAIIIETMTDLTEATLAIRAAKQCAPGIPVAATMTFDPTPRGFVTVMGVTIERAAAGLIAAGADLIGSNCGNGIDQMVQIANEFRKQSATPLIIQANAGLPVLKDNRAVYTESPPFMAERVRQLLEAGVAIMGGCCGTTPDHIAAFRREIDRAHAI